MSRIGKMPVALPSGVKVSIDGTTVNVKGPKGELSQTFHEEMTIKQEDGKIVVSIPDDKAYEPMHGLTRALMGSTAERVVRHATCPVLVLRG